MNTGMIVLKEEELASIDGGLRWMVDVGCAVLGAATVLTGGAAGLNPAGAFCAGWAIGRLFG